MKDNEKTSEGADVEDVYLTEEDRASNEASDEQFERGEWVDFETFAAETRKKYGCE